jgi:TolB protein
MKRIRRVLIIGVVVVIVVIAALVIYIYTRLNKDTIQLGKTDGDLAFMSDRDGDWDIYMLDSNRNLTDITASGTGPDYLFNFVFSGNMLNFYASRDGTISPATVNADGTNLRTLNFAEAMMVMIGEQNVDWDPAWSPDGTRLVWNKLGGFPPAVDVYISNADGSDARKLTGDASIESQMAWSPDGTRLVYISDQGGNNNVYVMDVASGDVTQITDTSFYEWQPVWSLDGADILFIADENETLKDGALDLFLIKPDGSELRPLGDATFEGDPTYAPSGEQVAYITNESGSWQIYIMNADGSDARPLTEGDSNNLFPAWRPVPAEEGEAE